MKSKKNIYNFIAVSALVFVLMIFIAPDIAEARRGGRSFGGRRSSSRSYKSSSTKRTSTAKSRKATAKSSRVSSKKSPSFGGKRMSRTEARKKYGTPRKTVRKTGTNQYGGYQNYRYHTYGGYGSSLMTGYMMGSVTSYMMWMPWSGYYWYSRPSYSYSIPDDTKIKWHVDGGQIVGASDEPSVDIEWGPEGTGTVTVVLSSRKGGTEKKEMNVKIWPAGSTTAKPDMSEGEVKEEEVEEASISGPFEVVSGAKSVYSTGTYDVYPPTFNWSKTIITIIVLLVIIYIIKSLFFGKKKKQRPGLNQSSFG